MNQAEIIESTITHTNFSGDNKKSEKKKIEMEFVEDNISIYSQNNLKATQHNQLSSMNAPTKPIQGENGKETAPAYKKRMTAYDAEMVVYNKFIRENPPASATAEESEEEYDEDEEDGSEEGSDEEDSGDEEDSEEESDEEEGGMTASIIIRETASFVAPAPVIEEEDEEVLFERQRKAKADLRMAELRRLQDEEDEQDRIRLQAIKAKKMRKDTAPLRAEADALIKTRMDEIDAKITALTAERDANALQRQRIQSGEMDEELIKAKTDGVKITPTIAPQKTASVKVKTDGEATRTRTATAQARPKGGDIMTLFNQPALIRCKMGEAHYYGLVEPDKKRIRSVNGRGVFNPQTDGVISHDTKTVKMADGKTRDEADKSQPERKRTEWNNKDLWIKSCKGEQNLYSSTKNGWKEIYYWRGDPKDADKNDPSKWVQLLGVAYDGVKLN